MLELRQITADEFEEWVRVEARAYGNRLNADPESLRPSFDLDRSIAVFDGGDIVGGAHSHLQEISIPGATSAIAGVANIEVQPTHRRRGIMTMMMHHQLKDVYERGEPLAGLFASESVIYGRFGYGIGSLREEWSIERHYTGYAHRHEAAGRFAFINPSAIGTVLPDVFRRSTVGRPGVFQKAAHLWEREASAPEHRQGGRGGIFYVGYYQDDRMEGYARYRTGEGTVTVQELMATTRTAAAALWRFCFDTDLVTRAEAERRPVDDPLPWMLADPRRLSRGTRDGLWLRLVNVAAALTMREYAAEGRLVIEVRDEVCPWNATRFALEASCEGAHCKTTEGAPDISIGVAALGSTYLGTVSFTTLEQAGLLDEKKAGALERANRMFAVQQQPWTPCGF
ncbi:MAG: GNAT family N-acetyltransferase [Chloroflexi bacterium]|nr:GNAT family N-acetyltransferase [Chloroflexota bacterium]